MDNIAIIPLSKSSIDWQMLISETRIPLGRSITRSLDLAKIKPDSLQAFIACLAEIKKPYSDPKVIIREPGTLMRSIDYGYLIVGPRSVCFDLIQAGIKVVTGQTVEPKIVMAFATASLEGWYTAITIGLSMVSSKSYRQLLSLIMQQLEKDGWMSLFHSYSRSTHSDGTLLLELR